MASARIGYEQRLVLAELEWLHMDSYFLDAANTAKYEGHDLWNLRVMVTPTPRRWLGVRVNNLTDKLRSATIGIFLAGSAKSMSNSATTPNRRAV